MGMNGKHGFINSSLCHALRKRSLVTTDIFVFNVGKAKTEADVNYKVLDGHIFASKYDSTELQFKNPKLVIVFFLQMSDQI